MIGYGFLWFFLSGRWYSFQRTVLSHFLILHLYVSSTFSCHCLALLFVCALPSWPDISSVHACCKPGNTIVVRSSVQRAVGSHPENSVQAWAIYLKNIMSSLAIVQRQLTRIFEGQKCMPCTRRRINLETIDYNGIIGNFKIPKTFVGEILITLSAKMPKIECRAMFKNCGKSALGLFVCIEGTLFCAQDWHSSNV